MNRYRKRDAPPINALPEHDLLRMASTHITQLVVGFLGLSVAFFVLTAVADNLYPGTVTIYVWGRVITELVLGVAYFLFAYLFRRGKFWGYLRMLMTSALALLSTLSVVFLVGDYPIWLRLEQALQAIVVLYLMYLLTRPAMRTHFRKK